MELYYEANLQVDFKNKLELTIFPFRNIQKAVLSPGDKDKIRILFVTAYNENEIKKAKIETMEVLKHYELVFHFKEIKLLESIELKKIIMMKNGIRTIQAQDKLALNDTIKIHVKQDGFDHLKKELESFDLYKNEHLYLFHSLAKINDKLGRFVIYYSILIAILGNQKNVDCYIREVEQDVEEKSTTRPGKSYTETIYTHIRNQIGHSNKNTDILLLDNQINENLSKLSSIVLKAILTTE